MCGGRWPRATKCVIDNRSEETLKCRHRPIIVVDDCTFRFQTKWRKKNNWERIKKKTTFACIRNCCLTQITNGDPLSKKPRVFGFDSKSTRWTSKKLGNNSVTRRTGGAYLVQAEGATLGDANRRAEVLRRRFGRQQRPPTNHQRHQQRGRHLPVKYPMKTKSKKKSFFFFRFSITIRKRGFFFQRCVFWRAKWKSGTGGRESKKQRPSPTESATGLSSNGHRLLF